MSILFYRRPDYVSKEGGPLDSAGCQKYVERAAGGQAQIPDNLSFDSVLEGRTMPVGRAPDPTLRLLTGTAV
jgi:hypothetical protein